MILTLAKNLVRLAQSALLRLKSDHISHAPKGAVTAIVIGNGPSLRKDVAKMNELAQLHAGRVSIYCVNSFPSTDLFRTLRPENLVLADHAFWSTDVNGRFLKSQRDLLEALSDPSRDFNLSIFLPSNARNSTIVEDQFQKLPRVKIYFFNAYVWRFGFLRTYLQSKNLAAPTVQNVMIGALYVALLRGAKKIYAFGLEQSFHLSTVLRNDNVLCFKYRRFYTDEEIFPFYKDPSEKTTFTVKEFFQVMVTTFESFQQLATLAQRLNSKIINLTSNTFVDTFKREDI